MDDWMPGADRVATPNFGYPAGQHGRAGQRIVAIVNHIAQQTLDETIAIFQDPTSDRSSTFCIGKDGRIVQFLPLSDAPWTNGVDFAKGPAAYDSDLTVDWIRECWERRVSPNLKCVTLEHEGMSGHEMPEAQVRASIRVQRWVVAQTGIRPDASHVVGHFHIDSVTKRFCPGPTFPWDRVLDSLAAPPADVAQYEDDAWRPIFRAATWLGQPPVGADRAAYESEVWKPLFDAAQFLFERDDPADADAATRLLAAVGANKRSHGAQAAAPTALDDAAASRELLLVLTANKQRHGAQ
jgi:N-acetyl-anhydromuramyl-L-alanine amidase AmpD